VAARTRKHIHKFIWFRRLSPYEVLNVVFSVLGLLSLYFLLEQTRGTFVQAQHLARSVESGAYQSIANELLELHKLYLEHPALRPYFRDGRDLGPDNPNYEQALVLAEYQLDFFDSVWVQSEQMPQILDRRGAQWLSWVAYMKDSFALSPIMCRHLDRNKTWYTPEFVAFARASCPKGLISQVGESGVGKDRNVRSADARSPQRSSSSSQWK
jgi:hypothetical protein